MIPSGKDELVVERLKKVLENGLFKASLGKSPLFSRLQRLQRQRQKEGGLHWINE